MAGCCDDRDDCSCPVDSSFVFRFDDAFVFVTVRLLDRT